MGTMVLLDLMGGVALLLWGLHMVHSGILRAFGPDLRLLLAKALNNRFAAFAAGVGVSPPALRRTPPPRIPRFPSWAGVGHSGPAPARLCCAPVRAPPLRSSSCASVA